MAPFPKSACQGVFNAMSCSTNQDASQQHKGSVKRKNKLKYWKLRKKRKLPSDTPDAEHDLQPRSATNDLKSEQNMENNTSVASSEYQSQNRALNAMVVHVPRIEDGLKGFLITCDRGRESKCVREILDLFHEVMKCVS
jgi:hypothetical protein